MTVKGTPVPDKERDRAFEKFFPLIKPIASRFVQTYRLPKDQTEDLEQEGSIGLLNAAAHRGGMLSRDYAGEAIKNEIWRHCKKILASQTEELNEDEEASEKFQNATTPRTNGDYSDSIVVKEALEKLDPQETDVVRLRHEMGLDVREAAKQMDLHRSKVSRIEKRVREKLKYLRQ